MKYFKFIVVLLAFIWICQPMRAVEWEARTGVSLSDTWGLHIAALAGFPVSESFQIKPGLFLHTIQGETCASSGDFQIGANIPVYASFRVPMGEICKLRLEAGPYIGAEKSNLHIGGSAGIGMERLRWSWGISYFGNCLNNKAQQFHLSVGYNFSL